MLLQLSREAAQPAYRRIADEIQRQIRVGVLKPGDQLPASRVLADDLKLNVNTVQHAFRVLVQEGSIEMRRGLGAFVSAAPRVRQASAAVARQIAERALREAFQHGLLASDLRKALDEIAAGES